jgi:hypothetical protein
VFVPVSPNGVSAVGSVGNATVAAVRFARVFPVGVQATCSVSDVVFLWDIIDTSQVPNWAVVDDSQAVIWGPVSTEQIPNWAAVDDSSSVIWTSDNDNSIVNWVQLPA